MCAKVAALSEVAAAADASLALVDDDTPRVRAAAGRVLGVTGEAEHADGIRQVLDDRSPRCGTLPGVRPGPSTDSTASPGPAHPDSRVVRTHRIRPLIEAPFDH